SDPVLPDESSPSAPGRYRFPYRADLIIKTALRASLLATGAFIWWLAAWIITGDPLYIKHDWPQDWSLVGTIYGAAGLVAYPSRLPEIVGLWLLPPFFYGLFHLLKRRQYGTITSSFLLAFLLHTVLRAYGMLGSAGYPRYCVTISPVIAVITLVGWNRMANFFPYVSRPIRTACSSLIIAMSFYFNFVYADGNEASRDALAVRQLHDWFQMHPQPVAKFIWSQAFACILFNRDPWEQPGFT